MKKLLVLLFSVFVCFSACKQKQEDILAGIRKHRDEIDGGLKKLTLRQVDDLTSVSGGSISGYYRDEEIKKIYSEHFGDKSRSFSEYYFDDGMLIFINKQEYVYNKPRSYTEELARSNNDSEWYDDTKTRLEVNKYYFYKNKLVKWVDNNGNDIPVNKPEFINRESSLWAETVIHMKQLKDE